MPKPDISIVIPAYNAAHCLEETLKKSCAWLSVHCGTYEIVVVDDGSTDETWRIFESVKKTHASVHGIRLEKNRGKGFAVRRGMLAVTGTTRAFMDADGSTDISCMAPAEVKLGEGFDVVIATRSRLDARGARQSVPQHWFKRYVGKAGNLVIQAMGLWGIWDTQCGFKVFSGKVADRLFARSHCDTWAFDAEILMIARHMGMKIGKVPVEWVNNPITSVKPSDYFKMLKDVIAIRIAMCAGRYDLGCAPSKKTSRKRTQRE